MLSYFLCLSFNYGELFVLLSCLDIPILWLKKKVYFKQLSSETAHLSNLQLAMWGLTRPPLSPIQDLNSWRPPECYQYCMVWSVYLCGWCVCLHGWGREGVDSSLISCSFLCQPHHMVTFCHRSVFHCRFWMGLMSILSWLCYNIRQPSSHLILLYHFVGDDLWRNSMIL